jgi:hypothetical protein
LRGLISLVRIVRDPDRRCCGRLGRFGSERTFIKVAANCGCEPKLTDAPDRSNGQNADEAVIRPDCPESQSKSATTSSDANPCPLQTAVVTVVYPFAD